MIELDHVGPYSVFDRRRLVERWPLREGAVRSVFVVVRDVGRENVVEVAATEDQDPVEAFAACAADPAFGVRPCCRRPHGRFDETRMPSERKTSSNSHVNLPSLSRI